MVGQISEKICWEYTDNPNFVDDVTIAGKLHDIGKIGIKDDILFKKDTLTQEEYEIIYKHPVAGYKIIKPIDNNGKISEYILHHHERWNGEGYPHESQSQERDEIVIFRLFCRDQRRYDAWCAYRRRSKI